MISRPSFRSLPAILLLTLAFFCSNGFATAQEATAQEHGINQADTGGHHALVDYLEKRYKQALSLQKRQSSSQEEVDRAQALLVLARHDLAVAGNNRDEVILQCRLLIDIRRRELERQLEMGKLGFASKRQQLMAKRHQACAEYQLASVEKNHAESLQELKLIVRLSQDELAHFTNLHSAGAVSTMEVNRARFRATIAEHRLAVIQNLPDTVMPKLQKSVEVSFEELKQIDQLRRQGYADVVDHYLAHNHALNARLLLANVENDQDEVAEQLDRLLKLHEETLPKLGSDAREKQVRLWIQRERSRDRQRKMQVERDGFLADDLSVAEICY